MAGHQREAGAHRCGTSPALLALAAHSLRRRRTPRTTFHVPRSTCMSCEKAWEGRRRKRKRKRRGLDSPRCKQRSDRLHTQFNTRASFGRRYIYIHIDTYILRRSIYHAVFTEYSQRERESKFIRIPSTRITSRFDTSTPTQPSIVLIDRFIKHSTTVLRDTHGTEQTSS